MRRPRTLLDWLRHALLHLPLDAGLLRARRGQRRQLLDRQLAWTLAFVAGAINAGGFLAVGVYTSHVTGSLSRAADELVLGHTRTALAALSLVLFFLAGAFTTGIFVQLGIRLRLRGRYALALAFEALLLVLFGLRGTALALHTELLVPLTVVLLCFLMGMHNAVVTHISSAVVRTTHMTGVVTDIGIELARWTVGHGHGHGPPGEHDRALRSRLTLHAMILASFFAGGLVGAVGFSELGYPISLAFAFLLLALAVRPIALDLRLRARHGRLRRSRLD
ncbi:MAG: YoaK family protein [Planctomycetota bacterium]